MDLIRPQTLDEAASRYAELTHEANDLLREMFDHEVWAKIDRLQSLYGMVPVGSMVRGSLADAQERMIPLLEGSLGHLAIHYVRDDWDVHDHAPVNPHDLDEMSDV